MNLLEYFETKIQPCRKCSTNLNLKSYLTFEKLPPFNGDGKSKVLIIGHSPKVRTTTVISETLDLNQKNNLRKYIIDEILTPLNISINDCSATNIVKCMTIKMPEEILIDRIPFMDLAFNYCKHHLQEEVRILKPILIISLSETVSNLLQIEFSDGRKVESMQEIFATSRQLNFEGEIINWIPVVHIPKFRIREHYFPEQTKRLERLGKDIKEILNLKFKS